MDPGHRNSHRWALMWVNALLLLMRISTYVEGIVSKLFQVGDGFECDHGRAGWGEPGGVQSGGGQIDHYSMSDITLHRTTSHRRMSTREEGMIFWISVWPHSLLLQTSSSLRKLRKRQRSAGRVSRPCVDWHPGDRPSYTEYQP